MRHYGYFLGIGLVLALAQAQQARLSGVPAGGPVGFTAYSVSDDGQLVVGYGWDASYFSYPVAWHVWQPPYLLPQIIAPNFRDSANGVSGDGSTIVGVLTDSSGYPYPAVWRPSDSGWSYTLLPVFADSDNRARAASFDGQVVVGQARPLNNANLFPARWRETNGNWQLTDIFSLGGPFGGVATGVSANGEWVVGWAHHSDTWMTRAFIARSASEITMLPIPAQHNSSQAWGVSANGDVVVGWSYYASTNPAIPRACVWRRTPDGWVHEALPGFNNTSESYAYAVSADGRVIVGYDFTTQRYYRALIWIDGQVHDMNALYGSLLGGWFSQAYDISANGRYVVGSAYNGSLRRWEAFWLDRGCVLQGDVDRDGRIDDADLLAVLFAFGQTGSNLPADVSGDGRVDDTDLLIVLFNFGQAC